MPQPSSYGTIYVSPGVSRLYACYAVEFGLRVLQHIDPKGRLGFESLHRAAGDMIREDPGGTALYLASLVALDMKRVLDEEGPSRPVARAPSPN